MKWINDSELVIKNKVYHISNPEWIKSFMVNFEKQKNMKKRKK